MKKDWEKEWELFWGIVPKGSVEYKIGQEIKAFIKSLLEEVPCCGHGCCCNKGRFVNENS